MPTGMKMINDSSKLKALSAYTVVACLMSVALISAPVSAYNGIQLNNGPVGNFTLVDQNNSEYKLSYATEDIVIVSFFFTRCPDVCPVITQNLKLVQDTLPAELEDKVDFVSVTLDPKYDTPEVLTEYMEKHGVDWPHLTGPTEDVKDVWDKFAIYTEEYVIDPHDDNVSDMEGKVHDSSIVYVRPDGTAEELMYLPTGLTLTYAAADEAGWTVNASQGQQGMRVDGINGYDAPEDYSWWWSPKVFDEDKQRWVDAPATIDGVNALEEIHLGWYATGSNINLLNPPSGDTPSVQVVFPDNTTASTNVSTFTGYHLTQGAFDGAGIEVEIQDSSFGHFLSSIGGLPVEMERQVDNASVVYVKPDGTAEELMFLPTGMTLTSHAAEKAGWTMNTSDSQFGTMVNGFNGYNSPEDWSWWWSLKLFNEETQTWEDSPVGIDSVNAFEHPHLAWIASNANSGLLENPTSDTPSVQIVFPDNSTDKVNLSLFTGYHLTQGAFDGAGIDVDIQDSSFGHFLNSIDGVSAPSDWSWWWQLHVWNETSNGWEDASVGMDLVDEPMTLAWAPNSTSNEAIPEPSIASLGGTVAPWWWQLHVWDESSNSWEDAAVGMDLIDEPMTLAWASNDTSNDAIPEPGFAVIEDSECDGHGWIMGSGSSAHCMCDEGYEWAETDMLTCIPVESEPEYTVGHFAYTYILDEEKKPRVRYVDDSWLASDFVEDIVKLAEREGIIGGDDSEGIPSVGLLVSVAVVSMAAISLRSKSE